VSALPVLGGAGRVGVGPPE